MLSPRDGAVRWIWNLPEGDVGRMISLIRKTKETAEGAGVWQSTDSGEQDLALCAVSAAWQEISRCLPGYFDPYRELDKGQKAAARDTAPARDTVLAQDAIPARKPSGQADCGAQTADLIVELAVSGARTSV